MSRHPDSKQMILCMLQVLSSLQLGPTTFVQRTAITARAGEEAVLIWTLTQQDGRWCVGSIKRDESCDYPLPSRPHPRCTDHPPHLACLHAFCFELSRLTQKHSDESIWSPCRTEKDPILPSVSNLSLMERATPDRGLLPLDDSNFWWHHSVLMSCVLFSA